MFVLIDGHNLIGKLPDISLSDADDEQQLVEKIMRYRARTGRRVTIVFDSGGAYKPSATKRRGGLTVRYAPHGITADSLIIKQLRRERNPKEVLVITSDRAIQRAATQMGAQIMSSQAFADVLADLHSPAATVADDVHLSDEEIDDWLSLFGEVDA